MWKAILACYLAAIAAVFVFTGIVVWSPVPAFAYVTGVRFKSVFVSTYKSYLNWLSSNHKFLVFSLSGITVTIDLDESSKKRKHKSAKKTVSGLKSVLLGFVIRHFLSCSIYLNCVKIRLVSAKCPEGLTLQIGQIKINTNVHNKKGKFFHMDHYVLVSNVEVGQFDGSMTPIASTVIINAGYSLNYQNLSLSDVALNFNFQSLSAPLLTLLKYGDLVASPKKSQQRSKALVVADPVATFLDEFVDKLKSAMWIIDSIASINFTVSNVEVDEIYPFFAFMNHRNRAHLLHHKDSSLGFLKQVYFRLNLGKFTANFSKLNKESAGYELAFSVNDTPVEYISSLMNLRIAMFATVGDKLTENEIFQIPNINFSIQNNMVSEILRVLTKNKKLASAVFKASSHVSSPTVEFDSFYFGILARNFSQVKDYCKFNTPNSGPKQKNSNPVLRYLYASISRLLPLISLKVTIEDTMFFIKNLDNDMLKTVSVVINFVIFESVTKKKFYNHNRNIIQTFFHNKIDISGVSVSYQQRKRDTEDESFGLSEVSDDESDADTDADFPSKSSHELFVAEFITLRVSLDEMPNVKVNSSCSIDTAQLDLSDLNALNGLSRILESVHHTSHYELLDKNSLEEDTASRLAQLPEDSHYEWAYDAEKLKKKLTEQKESCKSQLFQMAPEWLRAVSFSLAQFSCVLGARSILIPPEIMKDLEFLSPNETIQNSLRKVKYKIKSWNISLRDINRNDNNHSVMTSDASSVFTGFDSVDESLESATEHYWDVDVKIEDISVTLIAGDPRYFKKNREKLDNDQLQNKASGKRNYRLMSINFLKIPVINCVFSSTIKGNSQEENQFLKLAVDIPELDFVLSCFGIFLILSSISLVKITVTSYKYSAQHIKNGNIPKAKPASFKISDLLVTEISIGSIESVIHFPLDFKIKVQLLNSTLAFGMGFKNVDFTNQILRICVQSSSIKNYWERLLFINEMRFSSDLTKVKDYAKLKKQDTSNLQLNDILVGEVEFASTRLSIPHGFIIHRVFDNIGIMKKVLKQLFYSFKSNSSRLVLQPSCIEKPSPIPKIRIKSEKFLFNMDDDPFESQLNSIYQIGLSEQRERLAKLEYFVERLNQNPLLKRFSLEELACNGIKFEGKNAVFDGDNDLEQEDIPDNVKEALQDAYSKLEILQVNLSRSWINRMATHRTKFSEEIQNNSEYLWKLATIEKYPKKFNKRVWDGIIEGPPLLSVIIENLDVTVSSVDFDLKELPNYLNKIGKGMPLDMKYNMLVPINLNLRMSEFRAHLRDYPLPLIYMPGSNDIKFPISIKGNVIISEEFTDRKESMNSIFIPLVPSCEQNEHDQYYSLDVPKSLTSIKTFLNLGFEVSSSKSTRFTWGASYQPAIQQVMLNFDGFTKPPLDPSDKVGFWDKLRANIHGRINLKLKALDIVFKGSRDPHRLLNDDAGFMLSFADNVLLQVNKDDNPKEFIVVNSKSTRWVAPNHVSEPLLVWSRSSKDAVPILEASNLNISNLSNFYLSYNTSGNIDINKVIPEYYDKIVINLSGNVIYKFGVLFERKTENGRTGEFLPHYKVQMMNPKYVTDPDYDAYKGFRSHFIHMAISLYSMDGKVKGYNAFHLSPFMFNSFFKWWRLFSGNMSLPIRHGKIFGPAKATKKFSVYLTTIKYQFQLSPLYACHVYKDELNKTLSNLKESEEGFGAFGIKGKFGKFKIDLHQRKQQTVIHKEILNTTKKTMKMAFNVGEVDVESVDIRLINAQFKAVDQTPKPIIKNYDDDYSWFDINDYEELGVPFLKNVNPVVNLTPLMYTPRMMYFRKTKDVSDDKFPYGNEPSHDCVLSKEHSSIDAQLILTKKRIQELQTQIDELKNDSLSDIDDLKARLQEVEKNHEVLEQIKSGKMENTKLSGTLKRTMMLQDTQYEADFNNRFIIHNMLLKWNCNNRDVVFQYVHLLKLHKAIGHFMTHDAVASIVDIVNKMGANELESSKSFDFKPKKSKSEQYKGDYCQRSLDSFDEDLRHVSTSNLFHNDDYLIKLVSPQIQMIDTDSNDACIMVVAPSIEMKVISVHQKRFKPTPDSSDDEPLEYSDVIETRVGAMIPEANILAFYKEDVVENSSFYFSTSSYGNRGTSWPPFLGVELCTNGTILRDNMLLEKTSMLARYDAIGNTLSLSKDENDADKRSNKIILNIPKVIVSCDSRQYTTLYSLVWDLLIYSEPATKELSSRLEKLAIKTSLANANEMMSKIKQIQRDIFVLFRLESTLRLRRDYLSEQESDHLSEIVAERLELLQQLYSSMKAISLGGAQQNKGVNEQIEWSIRADSIICHMLVENREPLIDIALSDSRFLRRDNADMSNENIIQIAMIQGFNLLPDTYYQEMLAPHDVQEPDSQNSEDIITIKWSMKKPVGGIKVMKYFDVSMQPIKLQLDQETGKQILDYVFENENLKIVSSSSRVQREIIKKQKSQSSSETESAIGGDINYDEFSSDDDEDSLDDSTAPSSISRLNDKLLNPFDGSFQLRSSRSSTSSIRPQESEAENDDAGVEVMLERANNNLNIESFRFNSCVLCISYKGEGKQRLVSVSDFVIKLPNIVISRQILSFYEVSMFLKKVVTKSLLQHSGKLIGNKFKHHRVRKVRQPLNQLTSYTRFVSVEELQSEPVNSR